MSASGKFIWLLISYFIKKGNTGSLFEITGWVTHLPQCSTCSVHWLYSQILGIIKIQLSLFFILNIVSLFIYLSSFWWKMISFWYIYMFNNGTYTSVIVPWYSTTVARIHQCLIKFSGHNLERHKPNGKQIYGIMRQYPQNWEAKWCQGTCLGKIRDSICSNKIRDCIDKRLQALSKSKHGDGRIILWFHKTFVEVLE